MVWFNVDDTLAFHQKAIRAGNAALGLWVRAGSWCCSTLTDGFVPTSIARSLGTIGQCKALVFAGLWMEVEGGYRFHEWEQRQQTKADVEAKRETERKRKAKQRQRPDVPQGHVAESAKDGQEESQTDGRTESVWDSTTESGVESAAPIPSFPFLSPSVPNGTEAKTRSPAAPPNPVHGAGSKRSPQKPHEPEGFAPFWAAYPRRQSRGAAIKAYIAALKKVDAATILDGALRYATDPNRDEAFTKMPTTWLNGECWTDDPLPSRQGSSQSGPSKNELNIAQAERYKTNPDPELLRRAGFGDIRALPGGQ